jgi:type I restriction enzyme S subunit
LGSRIVTAVDNVILRPGLDFNRRFLVYRFSAKDYAHQMKGMGSGATMQRVSRSELGNLRISFPPHQEQIEISDFLDHKTARIDTLIAKKTRFIELLKEKRQAVITKAVTKGLDDSVEMKESGLAWLPKVPEPTSLRSAAFHTSNSFAIGDTAPHALSPFPPPPSPARSTSGTGKIA